MRFSQRIGKREVKMELDKEGISPELRNSLWTLVHELIIDNSDYEQHGEYYSKISEYYRSLWIHFYRWPIDTLPWSSGEVYKYDAKNRVRDWFYKADWDLVLDFIEFSSSSHQEFENTCNYILKLEMSAYRFVDGKLIQVNSTEEIVEIETAIKKSDKFSSVKTHLRTSLDLLSDRKKPDYRNSIKESISAVEALARIITKDDKATFGQALKKIEAKHNIPASLKSAFSSLYGYTSDGGGIRHSLLETDIKVDIDEARFMLITCSAFVNYLINKI